MGPADSLPPPPDHATPLAPPIDASGPADPDDGATTLRLTPTRVPARPGELTPAWRVVFTIGWMGVIVALAAVWNASRQLGLPTWWLGPESAPRPILVMLLPFAAPAVAIVTTLNRVRHAPWIGLAAAASVAVVGLGDLAPVTRLGVVELVIAGAGACISLAAFAGRYQQPTGAGTDGADTAEASNDLAQATPIDLDVAPSSLER